MPSTYGDHEVPAYLRAALDAEVNLDFPDRELARSWVWRCRNYINRQEPGYKNLLMVSQRGARVRITNVKSKITEAAQNAPIP